MTYDEWVKEGNAIIAIGRRATNADRPMVLNPDSWRFEWRYWRFMREGRRNGWAR